MTRLKINIKNSSKFKTSILLKKSEKYVTSSYLNNKKSLYTCYQLF